MGSKTSETPETDTTLLAEKIAATLRALVEVRPIELPSVVAQPGFWERCQSIDPNSKQRIFVDGFRGACQWNSLKVYRESLEPGLSLWCGYAFFGRAWYARAWCMLEQRIVETTVPFRLYHGAALLPEELEDFAARYGELAPDSRKREMVATMKDGLRTDVWGDDAKPFAETIGRERDWKTGEIKEGLGR